MCPFEIRTTSSDVTISVLSSISITSNHTHDPLEWRLESGNYVLETRNTLIEHGNYTLETGTTVTLGDRRPRWAARSNEEQQQPSVGPETVFRRDEEPWTRSTGHEQQGTETPLIG